MSEFTLTLSVIAWSLIACGITVFLATMTVSRWRETRCRDRERERDRQWACHLTEAARWLSEDRVTSDLLVQLARWERDIGDIREDWRKARKGGDR